MVAILHIEGDWSVYCSAMTPDRPCTSRARRDSKRARLAASTTRTVISLVLLIAIVGTIVYVLATRQTQGPVILSRELTPPPPKPTPPSPPHPPPFPSPIRNHTPPNPPPL